MNYAGGQNMTTIEKEDLTSKMQTDYSDVSILKL